MFTRMADERPTSCRLARHEPARSFIRPCRMILQLDEVEVTQVQNKQTNKQEHAKAKL